MNKIIIQRTSTANPDFQALIGQLDHELWYELGEDQATYDQFNNVTHIDTALVLYEDGLALACGCFKNLNNETAEIKRMYVLKNARSKGLSKKILTELENWAKELNIKTLLLETSVHFKVARALYTSFGFYKISNYGSYEHLQDSFCMQKNIN